MDKRDLYIITSIIVFIFLLVIVNPSYNESNHYLNLGFPARFIRIYGIYSCCDMDTILDRVMDGRFGVDILGFSFNFLLFYFGVKFIQRKLRPEEMTN